MMKIAINSIVNNEFNQDIKHKLKEAFVAYHKKKDEKAKDKDDLSVLLPLLVELYEKVTEACDQEVKTGIASSINETIKDRSVKVKEKVQPGKPEIDLLESIRAALGGRNRYGYSVGKGVDISAALYALGWDEIYLRNKMHPGSTFLLRELICEAQKALSECTIEDVKISPKDVSAVIIGKKEKLERFLTTGSFFDEPKMLVEFAGSHFEYMHIKRMKVNFEDLSFVSTLVPMHGPEEDRFNSIIDKIKNQNGGFKPLSRIGQEEDERKSLLPKIPQPAPN